MAAGSVTASNNTAEGNAVQVIIGHADFGTGERM